MLQQKRLVSHNHHGFLFKQAPSQRQRNPFVGWDREIWTPGRRNMTATGGWQIGRYLKTIAIGF